MQYQLAFNTSDVSIMSAQNTLHPASSNAELYTVHEHQHEHYSQPSVTHGPLFNVHEIWAISIATVCFLVGFPSNLISIVVCLRSLVRKPTLTRQRFMLHNKNGQQQKPNYRGLYKTAYYQRRCDENGNGNHGVCFVDPPAVTMSLFSQDNNHHNNEEKCNEMVNNFKRGKSASLGCASNRRAYPKRCRLLINLNLKSRQKRKDSTFSAKSGGRGFSAIRLARNPHRHCFELYLIEICFCDIFILAYFFLECVLLVLSRYNLIDSMYAEPVLISKFMCQFIIGFNRTIILLHNWLVSSLALTRCYAIYKPLNSTANFGPKFYLRLNLFVLVTLIFIFSALNILGVMPLEYKR